MEILKQLLDIHTQAEALEVHDRFYTLADKLLNEYEIVKGKDVYDFLEIEFYFHSINHEDSIAYARKSSAGKWLFHAYGVDINLESDEKHYGGILIRSLWNKKRLINGPFKVCDLLFGNIDIDGSAENLPLIRKKAKFNAVIPAAMPRFDIPDARKYRYYNASIPVGRWDPVYLAKCLKTYTDLH
ncbi:MAG: hypothetical protein LBT84_03940 [Spirochaetia bacterium]|jgi:hypothetical protein|nr:hypothetical protein [Spirochaetia bacterium]